MALGKRSCVTNLILAKEPPPRTTKLLSFFCFALCSLLDQEYIPSHRLPPTSARCWEAAIVYWGGILVMAYSSFLRTETKDQTEDSRSSRRKREADKQKARKGVREKGQDKELGSVWGGLSPSRHLRPRRIKQRQCDGQSVFFKRSSLRQPTSPTVEGFLAAFL